MSRDLKFRAWNKHTDEWVPFHGVESMSCWQVFNRTVELLHENDWAWQQYTGLKDRKGADIYEGDIVEYIPYPNETRHAGGQKKFAIEYKISARRCGFNLSMGDKNERLKHYEVIGNIYETPELLK